MHPNQNPKLDDPRPAGRPGSQGRRPQGDLAAWATELPAITMANSLGAEDMVLTDVICTSEAADRDLLARHRPPAPETYT
jgi:hypothetical protein